MASQHHIAKRRAEAFDSLAKARRKVADHLGVDAPTTVIPSVVARDPDLLHIAQIEDVAELLEAVAAKMDVDLLPDAITGDSKIAPTKTK